MADALAPFRYFFAGIPGQRIEDIPPAWHARFYLNGAAPWPDYPRMGLCQAGATVRRLCIPERGGDGIMAAPYSLPVEAWRGVLAYTPEQYRCEVEIEPNVWLFVAKDFNPCQIIRTPPMVLQDIQRVRGLRFDGGAGAAWIIPCCLPQADSCVLPMVDRLEHGQWRAVPRPAYRRIADIAARWYRVQCGEEAKPDREWLIRATAEAIAVNYEVTPGELGALDMLDDAVYEAVGALLTDLDARRAETEARRRGVSTLRAAEHSMWRAGANPTYIPTALDLDLAAGKLGAP